MLSGVNQLHASYRMDGTRVDKKTTQFQSMNVGDGGQDPCIWSSPGGGQKINIGKQIFCNRSLNMRNIVAVGFDMDYTLAQYKPETFESLAYEGTIKKLVHDLGYPPEVSLHFHSSCTIQIHDYPISMFLRNKSASRMPIISLCSL